MREVERNDLAITVTVLYAPEQWLPSVQGLVPIPVRCVIGSHDAARWVELATPLRPMPEAIARPITVNQSNKLRKPFLEALRVAVSEQVGSEVHKVDQGIVEWEAQGDDERWTG